MKKLKTKKEEVDKNYKELTSYIGDWFSKVEKRLEKIEEMKADKSDIQGLIGALDKYTKKAETFFEEMVMLSHKIDRHEQWLHQIAEKSGIRLRY